MKLAAIPQPGVAQIIEKPRPKIAHEYALIKVVVAPMCNEYIAYARGDFRDRNRPDSLGHEVAGVVEEIASHSAFRRGDRVVALSGYPCGKCKMCTSGAYAHCPSTQDPLQVCHSVSGECGFAQYMIKPDWLLLKIPEQLSLEHASMACCGMGASFTALETMGVSEGDTVLVTGLGPVGLGAVINGVARGARVLAAGSTPFRRDLALQLGAHEVLEPCTSEGRALINIATRGWGADHVIDCSALSHYQRFGLDAVGRGGSVTFLGESDEISLHIDRDLIQKGVTLHGSLDLYLTHAAKLLDVIQQTGSSVDTLITHEFPLADIEQAWRLQASRKCGKIILRPWE